MKNAEIGLERENHGFSDGGIERIVPNHGRNRFLDRMPLLIQGDFGLTEDHVQQLGNTILQFQSDFGKGLLEHPFHHSQEYRFGKTEGNSTSESHTGDINDSCDGEYWFRFHTLEKRRLMECVGLALHFQGLQSPLDERPEKGGIELGHESGCGNLLVYDFELFLQDFCSERLDHIIAHA